MIRGRAGIGAIGLWCWTSVASAQAGIRGRVVDPSSGRPAPGVRVEFAPGLVVWTSDTGTFTLTLPVESYQINLSCPRRLAVPLRGRGPRLTVADGVPVNLELPGGSGCLPALSATEYGEFEGIYLARPGAGWFRLCGDTTYQIGTVFSAAAWNSLNRLAGQAAADKSLVMAVRGGLAGPGSFEGGAEYRLGVEQVKTARFAAAGTCR